MRSPLAAAAIALGLIAAATTGVVVVGALGVAAIAAAGRDCAAPASKRTDRHPLLFSGCPLPTADCGREAP